MVMGRSIVKLFFVRGANRNEFVHEDDDIQIHIPFSLNEYSDIHSYEGFLRCLIMVNLLIFNNASC